MSDSSVPAEILALAVAWATVDGRERQFQAGAASSDADLANGGHYGGYLCDAWALHAALERRGFMVALKP